MLTLLQDQRVMEENLEKIYDRLEEGDQKGIDNNGIMLPDMDHLESDEILDEVFEEDILNRNLPRQPLSEELQSELHLLKKTLELERSQIKYQLSDSLHKVR